MEEKVSKPLLGLGILVVLVISTAFIPASWFGIKPVEKQYEKINIITAEDFKTIAKDNNNDGTPDWKNLLQKTYAESEEGAKTQAEIKEGKVTTVSAEEKARLNDPNNLTTSFAKNVYVATAYMKENNITDEQAQTDTVNGLIDGEAAKISIKTYSEKDIKITTDEDKTTLLTYRDAIASIAAFATKNNFAYGDVDVMTQYSKSKNSSDLKYFKTKAANVDVVINKMLLMKVPSSAVSIHLLALNRLSAYKVILEGFATADTDSLRAALVARQYENTITMLVKSLTRFNEYFVALDIPFSSQPLSNKN